VIFAILLALLYHARMGKPGNKIRIPMPEKDA
jgi:hypothetical protein